MWFFFIDHIWFKHKSLLKNPSIYTEGLSLLTPGALGSLYWFFCYTVGYCFNAPPRDPINRHFYSKRVQHNYRVPTTSYFGMIIIPVGRPYAFSDNHFHLSMFLLIEREAVVISGISRLSKICRYSSLHYSSIIRLTLVY